mgnify:FL=1
MTTYFIPVETDEQTHQLANMATAIWNEYWPAIIGQEQTTYMIERFQSYDAITRDMAENDYEYWFVVADKDEPTERIVGFTGGHNESETNRFFISKIYLLAQERGKHFASDVIAFYNDLCLKREFSAMHLTVNKHNELGIRAYQGKGFETIDAVETDIGQGFIMDDFIMERRAQ